MLLILNNTTSTNNTPIRYSPILLTITNILYYIINIFRVADKDTNKTLAGVIRAVIEKEI